MLNPVCLHSNSLPCKSCPLDLNRKKHHQRGDVSSCAAQTQDVALPAMEVAALLQALLQSGEKKKIKKIPKSVSVHFLYRFTTLLSTSSPCIFELPCYRITRPFVSVRCTADCSLQTAARVAVSPGLLKGDRNRSGERSFRRFPLSQWELLRMPGTEPVSIGARIIGHP